MHLMFSGTSRRVCHSFQGSLRGWGRRPVTTKCLGNGEIAHGADALLGASVPLLGASGPLLGATGPLLGATPGNCAAAEIRI